MTGDRISDEDARAASTRMYAADVASQTLGIAIEDVAPGRATARMRITETMINGHDVAHGGYTFLLADTAFAFACNTYAPTVARAAEVSFLRPVKVNDELMAVAQERISVGSGGIYDVTVSNQEGEVVAEFRGHSRRLPGAR